MQTHFCATYARRARLADANASAMLKLTLMEMQMTPRREKEQTVRILKNGGEEGYRAWIIARVAPNEQMMVSTSERERE